FLSNVPWDFVWQRHQTLASLWGREAEVDYVELPGVRMPGWRDGGRIFTRARSLLSPSPRGQIVHMPGVTIHRPWVVPAASKLLCSLNRRLVNRAFAAKPSLLGSYDLAVVYSPA